MKNFAMRMEDYEDEKTRRQEDKTIDIKKEYRQKKLSSQVIIQSLLNRKIFI